MAKKTVLITGCSSGFGEAAALQFLKAGWGVAATMRKKSDWRHGQISRELLLLDLDVDKPESIRSAIAQAIGHFGQLDCAVNNAGRGLFSVFETTPMEAVRSIFDTNFFGCLQIMQEVIPYFRTIGGGRFVNVTSSSGIMPEPLMAIYGATKQAVESFSESVAYELSTQNIIVKLVEPGLVVGTNFVERTRQESVKLSNPPSYQAYIEQMMARYLGKHEEGLGNEEDVAIAIVAAASDESGRFRTQVGSDTIKAAHMRWETSEEDYRSWTRSLFAPREIGDRTVWTI